MWRLRGLFELGAARAVVLTDASIIRRARSIFETGAAAVSHVISAPALPLGAPMINLANATNMNGLPDVVYYDVMSSHVADAFRIFIGRPAQIEPGRSYPVIYVLDGNL